MPGYEQGQFLRGTPSPPHEDLEADAIAIFGQGAQLRRPTPTRKPPARQPESPAPDPWLLELFEPKEKREWLRNGLTNEDLELAVELRHLDFRPTDLGLVLPSKRTPLEYLRGGESIERVVEYVGRVRGA